MDTEPKNDDRYIHLHLFPVDVVDMTRTLLGLCAEIMAGKVAPNSFVTVHMDKSILEDPTKGATDVENTASEDHPEQPVGADQG